MIGKKIKAQEAPYPCRYVRPAASCCCASSHIQDRDGGVLVLSTLFVLYPFLQKLFADGGYQGRSFKRLQPKSAASAIEIVKRSDRAKGFELLPDVGCRTHFRLANRCRRLAKDFENLARNALAFPHLASIRLMLRKLCLSCMNFSTEL